MKKQKLFLFILSLYLSAINSYSNNPTSHLKNLKDGDKFIFTSLYINNAPWKELSDYSSKDELLFGKEIAQQICLIDHTFLIFSNSNEFRPRIVKPIIYNSLNKIRQHYKEQIKKNKTYDLNNIKLEFSMILIKGYLCYYEDTKELEILLQKAKNILEIKNIFDQITIQNS